MTLEEFFAALQNPNMVVTVVEGSTELTKIYASGMSSFRVHFLQKK